MPIAALIQIAGAGLVLIAFLVTQTGMSRPDSTDVLTLNMVGAAILATLAFIDSQWGFLALEGIWSLVAFSKMLTEGLGIERLSEVDPVQRTP